MAGSCGRLSRTQNLSLTSPLANHLHLCGPYLSSLKPLVFPEQADPRVPGGHQAAERGHRSGFQSHRSESDQIRQGRHQADERHQRVRSDL